MWLTLIELQPQHFSHWPSFMGYFSHNDKICEMWNCESWIHNFHTKLAPLTLVISPLCLTEHSVIDESWYWMNPYPFSKPIFNTLIIHSLHYKSCNCKCSFPWFFNTFITWFNHHQNLDLKIYLHKQFPKWHFQSISTPFPSPRPP